MFCRGLGSGGYFEFHGDVYDFGPIKIAPVPARPIPILVGRHAPSNIRRAAEFGDGWIAASPPFDRLETMVADLRRELRDHGREQSSFEIHASTRSWYDVDEIRRLEELGVTDVALSVTTRYETGRDQEPLAAKLAEIERFADEVISRCAP